MTVVVMVGVMVELAGVRWHIGMVSTMFTIRASVAKPLRSLMVFVDTECLAAMLSRVSFS